MAGNSFVTNDGTHVTGVVLMAVDEDSVAIPADRDAPLTVRLDTNQLCRALAAHASLITGKSADDALKTIHEFVTGESA